MSAGIPNLTPPPTPAASPSPAAGGLGAGLLKAIMPFLAGAGFSPMIDAIAKLTKSLGADQQGKKAAQQPAGAGTPAVPGQPSPASAPSIVPPASLMAQIAARGGQ